jgi:SAM-dependent methyltransferase
MPRSRLLARIAARIRSLVAGAVGIVERFDGTAELVPPSRLRFLYYRTWRREAFARACDVARQEILSHGLQPDHRLLDIGSGIGNLAIGLSGYLRGTYDGIEINRDAVTWSMRAITSRHPQFRFHHADVRSIAYNPDGRLNASEYRFPFPDQTFDFVFLGSVFTHMLPAEIEHYADEIARMLRPDGLCVASYFLLTEVTTAGVDRGTSFMPFPVHHPSGVARLHDARKPEAAVAIQEAFVRQAYDRVGLRITDVRRGSWWNGGADDQDVVTAIKS